MYVSYTSKSKLHEIKGKMLSVSDILNRSLLLFKKGIPQSLDGFSGYTENSFHVYTTVHQTCVASTYTQ